MSGLLIRLEDQTHNMDVTTPDSMRRAPEQYKSLLGRDCCTPRYLPLEQSAYSILNLEPPAEMIPHYLYQGPAGKRSCWPQRTFRIPSPAYSFGEVSQQSKIPKYAGHLLAKSLVFGRKKKVRYLQITPASKLDYGKNPLKRTPSPLGITSPWILNGNSPILLARPWTTKQVPGVSLGKRFWQLQDCEWYDVLRQAPFPLPRPKHTWNKSFCKPTHYRTTRRSPRRSLRLIELANRKVQVATYSRV